VRIYPALGTIAGAISMAAGEYVATKTQQQVMDGEIALERIHIAQNRDFELLELKEVLSVIGIQKKTIVKKWSICVGI
jgi:vacuolar iron transporter family protein